MTYVILQTSSITNKSRALPVVLSALLPIPEDKGCLTSGSPSCLEDLLCQYYRNEWTYLWDHFPVVLRICITGTRTKTWRYMSDHVSLVLRIYIVSTAINQKTNMSGHLHIVLRIYPASTANEQRTNTSGHIPVVLGICIAGTRKTWR